MGGNAPWFVLVYYLCLLTVSFQNYLDQEEHKCHCPSKNVSCDKGTGGCEGNCTMGWFGPNCQYEQGKWFGENNKYRCHCKQSADCDIITGNCPPGCSTGWFGPACQYVSTPFETTPSLSWLIDDNNDSCNEEENVESVTITLESPQPLSWVRIVVRNTANNDQFVISYGSGNRTCAVVHTAIVDYRTLDISCPSDYMISDFTLSGHGIDDLCSLYVSGGRNVALKESRVNQSSYDTVRREAKNAIDGFSKPYGLTCTHTSATENKSHPAWWTLIFSRVVNISKFIIYNRPNCCQERINKFTITAVADDPNALPFRYKDNETNPLAVYTITPMKIVHNVAEITIALPENATKNILTLCEVVIYGDSACEANTFGRECDRECNCKDGGDCFVHSGGCPSGCSLGFTGEDCRTECSSSFYGQNCDFECSKNCFGDNDSCHHVTGSCDQGCEAGYQPPLCGDKCISTSYGLNCTSECSEHCLGDDHTCHHVTGSCDQGCEVGYQPPVCKDKCSEKKYGKDCLMACSKHCADKCDHVTGSCTCQPGYVAPLCIDECKNGSYGQDCSMQCSGHCAQDKYICNHVTGSCDQGCEVGYEGPQCQDTSQATASASGSSETAMLAGVCAGVFLLIIFAVVILLWRRRRAKADPNADTRQEANKPKRSAAVTRDVEMSDAVEYGNLPPQNAAVAVKDLKAYLLQHVSDNFLRVQFQAFTSLPHIKSIPSDNGCSHIQSSLPENKKKNRFQNIVPYDATRVVLSKDMKKSHNGYINASYVKGFNNSETFIASQGPTDHTLNDFLRMILEKNVDQVVMLTNLIEQGKRKCSQYWPMEGVETFGDISVKLLTTRVYAEYTIRHLRLSQAGTTERDLTHYHFTAWPDKSVPDSPWGLVDLYHRVMADAGPGTLLVHCSAGVGRTGTFVALHNLLQEAEVTMKMDFLSTLWKLRQDRMFMVQTTDQYKFLHQAAIVGYVTSGTLIPVAQMKQKLQILKARKSTYEDGYTKEFQKIADLCPNVESQATAVSGEKKDTNTNTQLTHNVQKSRFRNIMPNETYRAFIQDESGHDVFINAVTVPTMTKNHHDLLTQLPLPSTVTDFWRLVHQYHVTLVVAFETDLHQSDKTIGTFLPNSNSGDLGDRVFNVNSTVTGENNLWKELTLTLSQKQLSKGDKSRPDKTNLSCLLIKTTPETTDVASWLELNSKVKSHRKGNNSRFLYMCRNGASLSGLACVQSILLDRLEVDQCLTVPLVVGTIKAIRPQVISTVEHYKLLYDVLRHVQEATNVYGNVGGAIHAQVTINVDGGGGSIGGAGQAEGAVNLYGNVDRVESSYL